MGRRGIGKSSLLKRIRFGNEYPYKYKIVIKKNEIFKFLINSETSCIIEDYKENCEKFFWISIFRHLSNIPELKKVNKFLIDSNLEKGKNIRRAIEEFAQSNTQSKKLVSTSIGSVINWFMDITRASFEDAREEVESFLRNQQVVILIDNLEDYPLTQQAYRLALDSVISVAVDFRGDHNNITVKCFIPSEIFRFVEKEVISNWGKVSDSIIHLHWKDGELISLLAKRLGYFLFKNGLSERMELSGFGNVSVAAKFIHKYFPQEILNQDAIYNHEKLEQDFIKEPLFPLRLRPH